MEQEFFNFQLDVQQQWFNLFYHFCKESLSKIYRLSTINLLHKYQKMLINQLQCRQYN